MSLAERVRRVSVAGLVALVVTAGTAFAATPKHAPANDAVPALPEPLSKEAVRELVARLSDEQVRKLLLDQLDRAAAASAKVAGAGGVSGMVRGSAEMMHVRFDELGAALVALPATLGAVGAKLAEPDGASRLPLIAGLLVAALALGWGAERLYDAGLRDYRRRMQQAHATTYAANAFRIAAGLALDAAGLVVFALASFGLLLALWHDHDVQRRAMFDVVVAVIMVRVVALLARFLLAPAESARLLPFADTPAAALRRFAVALAAILGAAVVVNPLLRGAGASAATMDLVLIAALTSGVALALWTVWRVRAPIAELIRGKGGHGAIAGWLADLWPVLATAYLLGILVARVFDVLGGESGFTGEGLFSLLLLIALPIADMALCRVVAAAAAGELTSGGERVRGFAADYESVFLRAIHIVVIVLGLMLFAHIWSIDVFEIAQRSMGGKIASSLVGICIVLLLAYMGWEIARTAIDRRLAAEGELDLEHPVSRLRTVLPILRALILVTIVVMATMSLLAALGVDILPLLAGASVVGVAIGFGSQTLVRDVVSGAFFLMDDAFRLGEYIEVGDAKGTVEKINIRSLSLRHHRGALNILPYGEIKRLRNTSRDWVVMVLDFRLTYDTSLLAVKKILKEVGDEIAADPELAPDLLQPLKLAGVMSTEDSAVVVRAKFMARPEGEPYMIRKAAYTMILKAFREAGIKFAHRQVTVYVPPGTAGSDAVNATAGAAALAAQPAEPPR